MDISEVVSDSIDVLQERPGEWNTQSVVFGKISERRRRDNAGEASSTANDVTIRMLITLLGCDHR